MDHKHSWPRWLGAFIFAVGVITVYKTYDNLANVFGAVRYFVSLLTPFFIGIGIAFFLYPGCRKLEAVFGRSKHKRIAGAKKGLSVLVVYAAFLLILLLGIGVLLPRLSMSIADFVKRLPGYMQEIDDFLREQLGKADFISEESLEQILHAISLENLYSIFFRGDWGQYVEGVMGVTSTLMSWFMGIVICAYALLERDSLFRMNRKVFGIFMKEETMDKIGFYVHEISSIFYKFFFGKAVDSLIVGVIAIIGFSLLGVPFALLMGVCILLFNMIPYFGPIIGAVPVVLVTLLVRDIYAAIWTALFILVLQQVDANIIGPKILSNSVGVSPFWVIFAILVFGGLFGVWGMIIGVPALAAIRMLLLDYLDDGKLNGTKSREDTVADFHPPKKRFIRKKKKTDGNEAK